VMTGNGKKTIEKYPETLSIRQFESLADLVDKIF
jgi:hypothetical protein